MKATRTCSLCPAPHFARDLCRSHYDKARYAGELPPKIPPTVAERLASCSTRATDGTGCLLWNGQLNKSGYGLISVGLAQRMAHKVAYELAIGPIQEGLELDHVYARGCRHRNCIEPAHLEPVTPLENSRRKYPDRDWSKCVHGHEFTPENTLRRRDGRRRCRECRRQQGRAAYRGVPWTADLEETP